MSDIIGDIDRAIGCQQCRNDLGASPSKYFCCERCQHDWHAARGEPLGVRSLNAPLNDDMFYFDDIYNAFMMANAERGYHPEDALLFFLGWPPLTRITGMELQRSARDHCLYLVAVQTPDGRREIPRAVAREASTAAWQRCLRPSWYPDGSVPQLADICGHDYQPLVDQLNAAAHRIIARQRDLLGEIHQWQRRHTTTTPGTWQWLQVD